MNQRITPIATRHTRALFPKGGWVPPITVDPHHSYFPPFRGRPLRAWYDSIRLVVASAGPENAIALVDAERLVRMHSGVSPLSSPDRLFKRIVGAGLWVQITSGSTQNVVVVNKIEFGSPLWRAEEGFQKQEGARNVSIPAKRRGIDPNIRWAVFERDRYQCLMCGSRRDLTLDHIKHFSRGGPDTYDNLRTLCRTCNSRRGNRW